MRKLILCLVPFLTILSAIGIADSKNDSVAKRTTTQVDKAKKYDAAKTVRAASKSNVRAVRGAYVSRGFVRAEITAYSPNDPSQGTGWRTSSRRSAKLAGCAAPPHIPLNKGYAFRFTVAPHVAKKYNIPASGIVPIDDRGGAIKKKKNGTLVIDLRIQEKKKCFEWGRKHMTLELVQYVPVPENKHAEKRVTKNKTPDKKAPRDSGKVYSK